MELNIARKPSVGDHTHGDLFVDGEWHCFTLEDTIREVPGKPVKDWKVWGSTAIPAGRYRVSLEFSQRFGPSTLTIHDVEGFDGIRMHGGNKAEDTHGCPLLGMNRGEAGISNCKPAIESLKSRVRAAKESGQELWITIANPGAEKADDLAA